MITPRVMRSIRLRAADAADAALGRRDRLTPPRRRLDFVGDSDFRATGEEFRGHFRELAELRSSDRVLDIGCGIGRMARVLVAELRPPGSYDGFDVVAAGISWCQERYVNAPVPFRFRLADVHNSTYNPHGREAAAEYRFPYPDRCFDLALATSVFTHLLPDAADRYLEETARVLAPGGRLLATWFLLGDERPLGASARLAFTPVAPGVAVGDPATPESAVAHEEAWLRERLDAHGLVLREPVHHGSWTGQEGKSFQDMLVADRRAHAP
jgi:SAM-dependent methyltransferase